MNVISNSRVAHARVVADRVDQGFAGIQSHPDLNWYAMCALNFMRIALHCLLHPQRSVAGSYGVILVSERRSEKRHDPVASHTADSALVTLDGFDHPK